MKITSPPLQERNTILTNSIGKVVLAELYTPSSSEQYSYGNTNNGIQSNNKYSSTFVKRLLTNHVDNAQRLRDVSDYEYNTNGIYRRLIDTTTSLISFEHTVIPFVTKQEKFKEDMYRVKYNKIRQYIWNCNFDTTLNDIIFKVSKYGRYSAYDRGNYLQPLPLEYTRIKGYDSTGNAILQFDFKYFDQFKTTVEKDIQLKGFDPYFRQQYIKYFKGVNNPKENLPNELNWRYLPSENTYTIKIGSNIESAEGIGLYYATIDDILYYDEIRQLDRDVISSQKRKIIVQKLPVDKECHSVLGEEEIREAHQALKALVPSNVGVLTVLGGTDIEDIPLQLSAVEKGKTGEVQEDIRMSSGVGESITQGGNYSSSMINVEVITNTLVKVLKQIEHIWFNRKFSSLVGNGIYQFKLKFLGITAFNKEKIIESFDGLLDKGGNLTPSVTARGFDIQEYTDILDIENSLKLKDKFEPLITSYTTTGKNNGRPKGTGKGGDGADKSNEVGANNNPSPSD